MNLLHKVKNTLKCEESLGIWLISKGAVRISGIKSTNPKIIVFPHENITVDIEILKQIEN